MVLALGDTHIHTPADAGLQRQLKQHLRVRRWAPPPSATLCVLFPFLGFSDQHMMTGACLSARALCESVHGSSHLFWRCKPVIQERQTWLGY